MMEDPARREVSTYFERTVGRPPAGVRDRVLHGLRPASPRNPRNLSWLALVAAVVLTALVVTVLTLSRYVARPLPAASPAPPPAAGAPQLRYGGAVTYDQARGVLLFFNGADRAGGANETWTWDGTRWTQHHSKLSPAVRSGAMMAYDESRRVAVMFGGAPLTPPKAPLSDTWTWDGSSWSQVATAGAPAIDPGQEARMAYDPVTRTVILYTASASRGVSTTHTWSFDGRQWVELHPSHSPDVSGGSMAYDGRRLILFGFTFSQGRSLTETWAWNSTDWSRLSPSVAPPQAGASSVYDPVHRQLLAVLLVGAVPETWTWDGATWARLHPAAQPDSGFSYVLMHDTRSRRVLMYSQDDGAISAWNGTTWTLVQPALASPSPRSTLPTPVAVPADQVPALVRQVVTGVNPRLLPSFVPSGLTATVRASGGDYTVTYTDDLHTRSVSLIITQPNPPPAPNGRISMIQFRGARAGYSVTDTTAALSARVLFWTEPGSVDPSSPYRGAGGVPYTLSAEGITEAEFFQIANSLNPV